MTLSNIQSFASHKVNRSVCSIYITVLLLVVIILLVGVSSPASALTGTGTAIDPYLISTAEDLAAFRDKVNGGQNDAWGVLTQDIDMSRLSDEAERENWTPIGYFIDEDTVDETAYVGTFDGREYKIINLKINRPDDNYVGLFGIISTKGRVRKINVSGTIVGNNYVGGIVGHNFVKQYTGKSGGSIVDCNAAEGDGGRRSRPAPDWRQQLTDRRAYAGCPSETVWLWRLLRLQHGLERTRITSSCTSVPETEEIISTLVD